MGGAFQPGSADMKHGHACSAVGRGRARAPPRGYPQGAGAQLNLGLQRADVRLERHPKAAFS